jgi:LuxR family maltose regulon positive regulatory protein
VDARLRDAERWLATSTGDDALARRVRSEVALYRAALAQTGGDLPDAVRHAGVVLDLAGADDHLVRGAAAGVLGLAHWADGDLETAHRWWSDSHAALGRAGHRSDTLGVSIALADIRLAQGRLRDARAVYARGLADAESSSPVLRGAADMHVGLAEVLREQDDLVAARQHLVASTALGEHAGLPQNRHRWLVAMARVRAAEGDLREAVELLDEAERRYVGDMFPDVRPVAAVRARMWAAAGRVGEALGWARDRGLAVDDDLTYLREFEHVTLVRVLLAGDHVADAARFLERLLRAAEDGGRAGAVLELLVLRALAQQAAGDSSGALGSLDRALTLAEPEGYVRVFVDEGEPLAPLVRVLARQRPTDGYLRRLLAALAAFAAVAAGIEAAPAQRGLVEPLSPRELEILRLLASDLDGPGIARHLVVSLNTVRTHTKNIYAKLGVNSRRAAVRRGGDLGLLAR